MCGFHLRAPPPSQHLKKILRNYPEGSQVFKEALQNADDAGAREFSVLLDERHLYSGDEASRRFLGPALVMHNDGLFTDKDWRSLQCMFESGKTAAMGKIGRFGMGSRSYFHLTDVLFVLSGSKFAFLDPDWILSGDGGAMGDLADLPPLLKSLYAPFPGLFGLGKTSTTFSGTIFRLPLRMGKFARQSTFAPYEYTVQKTLKIISRFKLEVAECLLFLQSVRRAQIWTWPEHEERPSRLFSAELSSRPISSCSPCVSSFESNEEWSTQATLPVKTRDDASPLALLLRSVRDAVDCTSPQWVENVIRGETGSLPGVERHVTVEVRHFDRDFQYGAEPVKEEEQQWIQCLQVVTDPTLSAILRQQKSEAMVPMIGVAFQKDHGPDFHGRAFTFLPLPDVSTGLPVHVHGSFYLTDNRRSLWTGGKDTDGQAQVWVRWNETLIRCMAPAYARVLALSGDEKYQAWPDPLKVDPKFRPLLVPLVREIVLADCVLGHDDVRWSPEECRFLVLSESDTEVLSKVERTRGCLVAEITSICQENSQRIMHVPEHVQRLLVLLDEVEKMQGATDGKKKHFHSISLLDVFYSCLLPDWRARNVHSLTLLTSYPALMFVLCKTLSRAGERHLLRFKPLCEDLPFLPVSEPGDESVRLLSPQEAYDPGLSGFAIARRMMPAGEFRTADVLKVLRRWGLKTALHWPDLAKEAFTRVALLGDQFCGLER